MRTRWGPVALAVWSGIVAALHNGKVAGTLPMLTAELGLGLQAAGWLTAVFSLIAALAGLAVGVSARTIDPKTLVVAGLAIGGGASLLGGISGGAGALFASRIIEGVGFIAVAVAAPALIVRLVAIKDLRFAMGVWGIYVPTGNALIMIATALALGLTGWRGIWLISALIGLASAVAVWRWVPAQATTFQADALTVREALSGVATRQPMMLASIFMLYGAQYLVVVGFIPLFLVQQAGMGFGAASFAGGIVAAANVAGNIAGGWLGRKGFDGLWVLLFGLAGMGLSSLLVFFDGVPLAARLAAAMTFAFVGGFVPSTLLGLAPQAAPRPALVAAVIGLMIQGAGIGQFLGPPMAAYFVQSTRSWFGAALFTGLAAALAAKVVLHLIRVQPRSA